MDTPLLGNSALPWQERPCGAPVAGFGTCEEVAASRGWLGGRPDPSAWRGIGWVCAPHFAMIRRLRDPAAAEAEDAALGAEAAEFWGNYGFEHGEIPHVSRRLAELDSLNSDTR